ncbi:MAG: AAC(3) family N-acetyltransferase [Candidatus Brocadiia bacterium]
MTEGKTTVTRHDIGSGLASLGVEAGDILLVHSSLSRFGWVEGGADAVIDALVDAVGEDGNVVVPTHTWSTVHAKDPVFDVRRTPSVVGRITEVFRERPESLRSMHPTHSCAAIGPLADELTRGHETQITPCGSRSPYQRLIERGGKIVFLGVTLFVNTTFHALEETACVPWLFDRFEILYVVDYEGVRRKVPSRRHADGLRRDYEGLEPLLEREGALAKGQIGDATVRVMDAARMAGVLLPRMAENPFLTLGEEFAKRERKRYDRWRDSW